MAERTRTAISRPASGGWAGFRRVAAASFAAFASAAVIQAPNVARACAVCTSGREDENNAAFLISTIFLSVLPLAALGTLVFVLWRRIRKLEAEGGRDAGAGAGPRPPAQAGATVPSTPIS